ncbi:hypothetical protein Tco_0096540, partial [Tanacetum coccineum]
YNCETLGYSEADSSCSSFRVSGDICLTPSSGSSVAKRSLRQRRSVVETEQAKARKLEWTGTNTEHESLQKILGQSCKQSQVQTQQESEEYKLPHITIEIRKKIEN